jgi:multicomponent Na+:H+ antiporter subunit E
MKRSVSLAAFLAALWWLLSGQTAPLLLAFGVASVLLTVWLARRMEIVDHESHPVHLSGALARYWLKLLREIVVSNVDVVRAIVSPRMAIEPHFLTVRTRQTTDLGKVILANSITLTPGTVTVDLQGDELLVHALTRSSGQAVEDGQLDRLVPLDCEARG